MTTIPTSLVKNSYWKASDATVKKTVAATGGQPPGSPFTLDNKVFSLTRMDKTVKLDDIEEWTISNNQVFGHAFHIHDVVFKIVARNGISSEVGAHEQGWKDVVFLPRNQTVSFVAKFDDYSDSIHPFMYHCHFSNHEDEGMMGQFVVVGSPNDVEESEIPKTNFELYPNPAADKLYLQTANAETEAYYVTITTLNGRSVMMLPKPELPKGIDVSSLSSGTYFVQMMDAKTKSTTIRKFEKK